MQRISNRRDVISPESKQTRTHNNLSKLLKTTSQELDLSKRRAIDLAHSPALTLCVAVIYVTRCIFIGFYAENIRGLPAASGGPAAGGNRGMWPAGPCSEVHHLGYDPPLQRPGTLQQSSGTLTGRSTDFHCLIVTHTVL